MYRRFTWWTQFFLFCFWYLSCAGHCVRHRSPNMTRTLLPLSSLLPDDYDTVYIEWVEFFLLYHASREAESWKASREQTCKGQRKFPGGGSAWTKYERMSKCSACQSVADAWWTKALEGRWNCSGDSETMLWTRDWAVRNDLERWQVITSYAAVSRSWTSFSPRARKYHSDQGAVSWEGKLNEDILIHLGTGSKAAGRSLVGSRMEKDCWMKWLLKARRSAKE